MARQRRLWVTCAAAVIALAGTVTTRHALDVAAAQPNHGGQASSAIYNGRIHVFELQNDTGQLEHAWWDGTAWNHEYLDGPGTGVLSGRTSDYVGEANSAVVYNGQLHDFYFDSSLGLLRHAWWNGTGWNFESLDGVGVVGGNGRVAHNVGASNSAVMYNGQLHDFYLDQDSQTLRHGWWDGLSWQFESPDPITFCGCEMYNSAIVYSGQLQDFYYDGNRGDLRHVWWNGTAWNFEYLDGSLASTPGHSSHNVGDSNSSIIYGGQLHDFYNDLTGHLRHAWWNGSGWSTEELDGQSGDGAGATADAVGLATATADYNGQLQVFYADDGPAGNPFAGPYSLRHAWYGGGWTRETLDGPGSAYSHSSDQVDGGDGHGLSRTTTVIDSGQIHVFTLDVASGPAYSLEHDWWDGSTWGFEQLQ